MIEELKKALGGIGLEITQPQLDRIEKFNDILMEKNKVMDLTNITQPREVALRHMADSLFLLKCSDFKGKRIIDIGTGAGFPGVPLLMYDDALDITMVDSTQKRIDFINQTLSDIGEHKNALAIGARAEDLGCDKKHRERYDTAVSRAVAPLNILCELCLPLVKENGVFLAMKSANEQCDEELSNALNAIRLLGGTVREQIDYQFAQDCPKRRIIVIEKTGKTPVMYPRKYAKIKAKPL